ncbi:MAG: hypothetical protein COA78_17360 [Blastopirellula sp.]|nr:MAG: hypothetical protein COA78_17360 [Blastopirellula sp.]
MKTLLTTVVVLSFVVFDTCAFAADLTQDGEAVAEIVIDATSPLPPIAFAAQELQLWVEKISGARLPIVSKHGKANTQVVLGTPSTSPTIKALEKRFADDLSKMEGNDGFSIRAEGNTIYVFARVPKGVLNGVFFLLEQNTDIIFVRPLNAEDGSGTIYGSNPSVSLTKTDVLKIPTFTYIRSLGERNLLWQTRLRNLVMVQDIPAKKTREKLEHLAPSWTTSRAIPRQPGIGKTHPEYFAIRDGKRQEGHWSQLCYSNKDLVDYYCNRVEDTLATTPDDVVDIRLAHADNHRVCQCEDCLKPIELPNGTVIQPGDPSFRSSAFWLLNNKAAERLGGKYPNRYPRGFAYVWSSEPPPFPLSENLMVMYAPYVKSHKVPIYHKENEPWGTRASKWMEQHKHIYVFEYYMCSTTPRFYNPVTDIAALDLRFYAKSGSVEGMYQDNAGDDEHGGTADDTDQLTRVNGYDASAIEYWVLSRLYWDPAQDPDELRDEFCRRAYREAAKPMRDFFRTIQKVWHDDPIASQWNDNPVMSARQYIVKNDLQEPCRSLLQQAEDLAIHSGSKDLIKRQRVVFEKWLRLESMATQKVELKVPYRQNVAMDDFDFDSGVWKSAATIDDFRIRNSLNKKAKLPTVVKVVNDRENLYFAVHCMKEDPELLRKLKTMNRVDGWPQSPFIELFIDGDQREKNGYYQLAFNAVGSRWDAKGRQSKYKNEDWKVTGQLNGDNWKVIVKLPLLSFGRNITMDNRFGMMIYRNTGNQTWLGVNVHEPSGFNDLILMMN